MACIGSSYNQRIVKEVLQVPRVERIIQGVDVEVFNPNVEATFHIPEAEGRFVVFSGGKMEARKGQDIVFRAFREFQKVSVVTIGKLN